MGSGENDFSRMNNFLSLGCDNSPKVSYLSLFRVNFALILPIFSLIASFILVIIYG